MIFDDVCRTCNNSFCTFIFRIMNRFSSRIDAANTLDIKNNSEDKRLILSVMLKLADMSHLLKPKDMCLHYSRVRADH